MKVATENARVPVTVLHVDGNIDSSTYQAFQAKVDQLIDEGARHLLIDLSHTPFVSSAGFRALHQIFNKLRSLEPNASQSEADVKKGISAGTYKSPHLKLLNLSRETRTTFEMSGFDMFIETYDDRKMALNSF